MWPETGATRETFAKIPARERSGSKDEAGFPQVYGGILLLQTYRQKQQNKGSF